jgi:uncharacterized membrane protein YfcA
LIAQLLGLAAAGLATGLLSGTLGVGGGFILVPLLTIIGLPIHEAIGTSLAFVVVVSTAGAARHLHQSSADARLAAGIALPGVLTAQLGAHMAHRLDEHVLALVLGLVLVAVAVWMLLAPDLPEGCASGYRVDLPRAALVGVVVGFASGLLGVGGGFLLVPALVLLLGIPLPVAVGTSLLAIILPAISGTVAYAALGSVDWRAVAATVPFGILGALHGARLAVRIPQPTLRVAFDVVLLAGAAKLLSVGVGVL